jgi:hypothetical protein
MEKIIKVGEREINFKVSAMTPLFYKKMYERDLFTDIKNIVATTSYMEVYEFSLDLSYCMAKQGDKDIASFDDWVSSFEMDDTHHVFSESMELWTKSVEPISPAPVKKRRASK